MLYRTINRNKKSVVLDLRTEDRPGDSSWNWPRASDIVLENFRPGHPGKMGTGPGGPERSQSGADPHPDLRLRPDRSDVVTARLRRRRRGLRRIPRTGRRPGPSPGPGGGFHRRHHRRPVRGLRVRHVALSNARGQGDRAKTRDAARATDDRRRPERSDVLGDGVPDSGLHRLRRQPPTDRRPDGRHRAVQRLPVHRRRSIVVAGNGDSIFKRYMEVIGRPDLGKDPGLQTNADRWERREELDQAIGEWANSLHAPRKRWPSSTRQVCPPARSTPPPTSSSDTAIRRQEHDPTVRRVHGRRDPHRRRRFPASIPVIGGRVPADQRISDRTWAHDTKEVLERVLGKTPDEADSLIAKMEMETV